MTAPWTSWTFPKKSTRDCNPGVTHPRQTALSAWRSNRPGSLRLQALGRRQFTEALASARSSQSNHAEFHEFADRQNPRSRHSSTVSRPLRRGFRRSRLPLTCLAPARGGGGAHHANFNCLAGRRYRTISLSVYGDADARLYAAVWVQREGLAWVAAHGVDQRDRPLLAARCDQNELLARYSLLLNLWRSPAAALAALKEVSVRGELFLRPRRHRAVRAPQATVLMGAYRSRSREEAADN